MANVIGGVKQLISNTEGEIADEKGIAANLAAVEVCDLPLFAPFTTALTGTAVGREQPARNDDPCHHRRTEDDRRLAGHLRRLGQPAADGGDGRQRREHGHRRDCGGEAGGEVVGACGGWYDRFSRR